MSVAAASWARSVSAGGVAEKCVLLALALRAGDGGLCGPVSRAALAGECDLSRMAVERALVTLAARGLIFRAASAETIEIALLTETRRASAEGLEP